MAKTTKGIYRGLRQVLDGSDPFMTHGHQIKSVRKIKKNIPEWINDNKFIQKLLLKSFPKLTTDEKQRSRAARWVRIIHIYFKLNMASSQIAEELEITLKSAENIVYGIRKLVAGKDYHNRISIFKKKGKPKKSEGCSDT